MMQTITDWDLRLNNNPLRALPALDIEEIFAKRPWEDGNLTSEQCATLEDAPKYLESVLKGYRIVQRTAKDGVVTADVDAIRAYKSVYQALKHYPKLDPRNLNDIVKRTLVVIRQLLSDGDDAYKKIDIEEIENAHQLFRALSSTSFSYVP